MNRKHSYRQLEKRQFAKDVLFYITDPEDAKSIFDPKWKNSISEKRKRLMIAAFEMGQDLLDSARKGLRVNISFLCPCVQQIKDVLSGKCNQTNIEFY